MKLKIGIGLIVAAVLVFVVAAYAAQQPAPQPQPGMPGPMGHPMMGMGPAMMGNMMGGMMGRSALAVQGGNVYVLAGDRLLKFDENLKLVREARIPVDMDRMARQMMQGQPGGGPMMPMGPQGGPGPGQQGEDPMMK